MNFNSLIFLIFLAVVVTLYWIIPQKYRYILLLIASYVFYMCWSVKLILLIVSTTLLTYFSGILMEKAKSQKVKKCYMIITIVFCLGLLAYFKYFNFLYSFGIDVLNIFNLNLEKRVFNIILPVGISFYTFQTLSYVIDVYKGKFQAEKNVGYYALFVSFFPQLVAGPIEKPGDLIPQLKSEKKINSENFITGFKYIFIGFVRKCCIADLCALYVNSVFADLSSANALAILLGTFLFLVQMYNDFAGYSEIALGSAKLLGIDLSVNFNFPLLSKSYTEFFRRWHITLNRWFTEYLYIPLGGNRKGKFRKMLNTLIVFALCGLWHGANWTFVLWGTFVALVINIETLLKKPVLALFDKIHLDPNAKWLNIIRHVVMIIMFSLTGIFFRSQSLSDIAVGFTNVFTKFGFSQAYFKAAFASLNLNVEGAIYLIIAVVIMILFIPLYHKNFIDEFKKSNYSYLVLTILTIFLIAFCWLYVLSLTDASGFQYFQF